jgi:DNA helicase II / ATP-dependent DNA helicase PcrA
MSDTAKFEMPTISDEETRWACGQLGMKPDAFCGAAGDDMRATVIRCMNQIDIAACPGSGKTTLLVAKLAILAAKWSHRTRGICVISHTNVARNEIESRLGHTAAGRRLLGHPHFIGTIHGFVNEFLAMPWLHSQGYRIRAIDTDLAQQRRWWALPHNIRSGLETNYHSPALLSAKGPDFGVGEIRWGKNGAIGPETPTYSAVRKVCRESAAEGYFCYDEMFMWAHDLMNRVPSVIAIIRDRFPLLLLDEAQDTKEEQAHILHRIFIEGAAPVTSQRFGDGNQAIFDSTENKAAAAADLVFPRADIQRDLPTSHRFGQTIANFANPFGFAPCNLQGRGPKMPLAAGGDGKHTIYLFDDQAGAGRVFPAFGDLLLSTFSSRELRDGLFKAVGQVHQNKGDKNFPAHLGHYWQDYDPILSRAEPKPDSFVQYVFAAVSKADVQGASHLAVEKIAEGMLRLSGFAKSDKMSQRANERFRHRRVLKLLHGHPEELEAYQTFVVLFGVSHEILTKALWNSTWCKTVEKIGEALAGGSLADGAAQSFLAWRDGLGDLAAGGAPSRRENFLRYSKDDKDVTVYLGSIHSVKGETHTATLILETFWYAHNLSSIRDWLLGKRSGGAGANDTQISRLKLHYVAMTRPSHLVCLALPKQALFAKAKDQGKAIAGTLKNRGWSLQEV